MIVITCPDPAASLPGGGTTGSKQLCSCQAYTDPRALFVRDRRVLIQI